MDRTVVHKIVKIRLRDRPVMTLRRKGFVNPRIVKVVAAIVVGLSIGTLVPPEPVVVPVVGTVSGIVVGGVGLVTGTALYLWVPGLVGTSECGCSGDCECS